MSLYHLTRIRSGPDGTFGILRDAGGIEICKTVERPWLDNAPEISCIPVGGYDCIPHTSIKFPNCWEITKVPGRAAILIHSANTMYELRGCIGVGDQFGNVNGIPAVLNSRNTLSKLRQIFPKNFTIVINEEIV